MFVAVRSLPEGPHARLAVVPQIALRRTRRDAHARAGADVRADILRHVSFSIIRT